MAAATPLPADETHWLWLLALACATDAQPSRVPVLTVWIDGARTSPAIGDRCTRTPAA